MKLNVGGAVFTTFRETLTSGSTYFRSLWSGEFAPPVLFDGCVFIDRNGKLFQHVLEYLRTGQFPIFFELGKGFDHIRYRNLMLEAQFYGVDSLASYIQCEGYLSSVTVSSKIYSSLNDVPSGVTISHLHAVPREEVYWQCPRNIKVHKTEDMCGRACFNVLEGSSTLGGVKSRLVTEIILIGTTVRVNLS